MKRLHLTLPFLAILCGSLNGANADTIFISDFGDGTPTAVVQRNGASVPITIMPDSTSEFLHFQFTSLFPAANTDTVSRDLIEPAGGDGTPQTLSDRFLLSFVQGGFINDVKFGSDGDPGSPTVSPGHTVFAPIIENGLQQVVLQTFFTGTGQLADQYNVSSDVPPGTVPGGLQGPVLETGSPQSLSALFGVSFPVFFTSDANETAVPGDALTVDFNDGFGPSTVAGGEYGQIVQNGYDFNFQTELAAVQFNSPDGSVSDYAALWQGGNGKFAVNYSSDSDPVGAIAALELPPPPEIPEPATLVMFATGLGVVLGCRRRMLQHRP